MLNKNQIYDNKLLEKDLTYIRLGDYTIQSVPILHKCIVCGEEVLKTPKHVLAGRGCKTCSSNNSRRSNQEYDEEIKDSTFSRVDSYISANVEINHTCKVCNNTYLVRPNSVLRGHGCKFCENRVAKTTSQYIEELGNRDITVLGEYIGNKANILHKCNICSVKWEANPNNVLSKESGCPECAKDLTVSKPEQELRDFIEANFSGDIVYNDRSILDGNELDIVLPDLGLAFEFNGMYWHSTEKINKNYHLNKTLGVEAVGFRLIHVFEDRWKLRKEICKSRILNLLGKSQSIQARKCVLKEIPYPSTFLNENHIQGSGSPTSYNYGLLYLDELVAVMTFSKSRFTKNCEYELIRYCSKLGTSVVGGAGKLLKAFTKAHIGSIVSYSDKCWSNGNLYKKLGFTFSHSSKPNYRYYKGLNSLSRNACQKHKLVEQGHDLKLTEFEIMKNLGYNQVYDSGNDVWILKNE